MPLPSPLFTVNAGAPGVKASVSAGGTVTCELDDITGVTYVEWSVITTDETTETTDYTLSTSGGAVPGNETMTFTAGIAATGGLIRAQINHGVNAQTGNAADEDGADPTVATAKWYVATSGAALEVLVDEEVDESDATHGTTGIHNQAIRAMSGGGSAAFTYVGLGSGTKSTVGLVRMARDFIALACKTAAAADHAILTEDNADGFVLGSSTLTAGWIVHVKTGGAWLFKVNNGTVATLNAAGLNIASGSRITGTGTTHTTAFVSVARNLVILGSKTAAAADHDILTEDNADGLLWGSTSTALQSLRVASGGRAEVLVNSVEVLRADATGIKPLSIRGAGTVPSYPGDSDAFINVASGQQVVAALTGSGGHTNYGFRNDGADGWTIGNDDRCANVTLAVKTGGNVTAEVNNAIKMTLDATALNLASGMVFQINGVALNANLIPYTPSNTLHWDSNNPSTVQEALDRIAAAFSGAIGPIT